MHNTELINRFIELRVQGVSIPKISQQIGVPAPTLYHWNERARFRIHKLRLLNLEQAEDRLLGTQDAQFEALAGYLQAIDRQTAAEIQKGAAENLSLPELIRIGASIRRQIYRLKLHVRDPLLEHAHSAFAHPAQPLVLSTAVRMDGSLVDPPQTPEISGTAHPGGSGR